MAFKTVPSSVKLWKHQWEALDFTVEHFRKSNETCLVRMPTGTGKTGVIGCLTLLSHSERSLVLTPWANLKKQMIKDLREDFWIKIGHECPKAKIEDMVPSNVDDVLENVDVKVIVATFTTLNEIYRTSPETFDKLAKHIRLTVADEGHYEPAVRWGRSVKALNTKTLLLTATPYRNDLKLFRIRKPEKSVFQITHNEAERNSVIRKVSFQTLTNAKDIKTLCAQFKRFWENHASTLPAQNSKAIIVCPDAQAIRETVSTLSELGLKALGVHDQFKGKALRADQLYRQVPDKSEDADIWVHQYKLMEGLDDDRFCCIALFGQIHVDLHPNLTHLTR